jgi:hypothetical protein
MHLQLTRMYELHACMLHCGQQCELLFCWLQEAVQAADVAAGLSLGEYTALTFAGALRWAQHILIAC